jgi:hypothetical protein
MLLRSCLNAVDAHTHSRREETKTWQQLKSRANIETRRKPGPSVSEKKERTKEKPATSVPVVDDPGNMAGRANLDLASPPGRL